MVALLARTPVEDEHPPTAPVHVMGEARGKSRRLLEEHLDPSRLDALHRLFEAPYQRGIDLFADLWRAALLQPSLSPEHLPAQESGPGKPYLVVQSLSVLARQLGWSYDALSQYLTLFCLLGLVEKLTICWPQRLCLLLPAGPYQPPPTLLSDLDVLIARPARRPKLKRLARQIRERVITSGSMQVPPSREPLPQALPVVVSQWDTAALITLTSHLTQLTAEVSALAARLKQTEQLVRDLLSSSEKSALPQQDTLSLTAQGHRVVSICSGKGSVFFPMSQKEQAEATPQRVIGEADSADGISQRVPFLADRVSCHTPSLADEADESRHSFARKADGADRCGLASATGSADVAESEMMPSPLEKDVREKSRSAAAMSTDVADVNTYLSADQADVNEPISAASALWTDGDRCMSVWRGETADSSQLVSALSADSVSAVSALSADDTPSVSARRAETADSSQLVSALSADGTALTSAQSADVTERANVNVTILSFLEKNTNVNVQLVADFLCQLFGEPASKQGIYAKLIRQGCHQPEAIGAAALYVLVHFHRDGTIDNPAACFIARCKSFHQRGIPQEAREVLSQYGHLTVQQFLEALRQPVEPSAHRPSGLQRIVPLSTPRPVPKEVTCPFPILSAQIPLASGAGMSKQEAAHLCWEANRELGIWQCRCGLLALPDQTYAVLLDAGKHEGIPRQVALSSRAQWQQEREDINRRLFDQSASAEARARFRQRMQQRRRRR